LLDENLISQHETNEIALKQVQKKSNLTEEENREIFLREVSLMWYNFFRFYLIFFFSFI